MHVNTIRDCAALQEGSEAIIEELAGAAVFNNGSSNYRGNKAPGIYGVLRLEGADGGQNGGNRAEDNADPAGADERAEQNPDTEGTNCQTD